MDISIGGLIMAMIIALLAVFLIFPKFLAALG